MKYKEFVTKVEELGFTVARSEVDIEVRHSMYGVVAVIAKHSAYHFEVVGELQNCKNAEDALHYITILATTPIEKRNDDKRYNVVACCEKYGMKGAIKERKIFYYRNEDGYLDTALSDYNADPDQQWTMQQIKDWGLEDCERISVDEADSVDEA